jgi:hypothetical protein
VPYSYYQLGQLVTDLTLRLQDPNNVFWAQAELILYIQEALRTWNAMAAWYRDRMSFGTQSAMTWYDLSQQTGTLIPYTVTDTTLFEEIEYHLLEPPTPAYSGSEMFTNADLVNALQKRRDQFLLETGSVIVHSVQSGAQTNDGRVALADSVIDIRRIAYLNSLGAYTVLWRSSESEANSFQYGWWGVPGPPGAYSVVEPAPVVVQIIPVPNIPGSLDLLTISAGATLNPSSGVVLGIPDDFSWVVKWGALADLLTRDGQASDPLRAQYCQRRWIEGVRLAKLSTTAITGAIDGNNVPINSVFDMDTAYPGWQNNTPTNPSILGLAGMNMLAVADPPNSAAHSVQLDLLRNMPIPVALTDPIQVGREELDVVTDYSEHLAAFKMGGAEFQATLPAYERMVALARKQNERWRAFSRFPEDEHDRGRRQAKQDRREMVTEKEHLAAEMEGAVPDAPSRRG